MDTLKGKTVLLATGNMGKLSELRKITANFGISICCLADLDIEGDAPETGTTFLENARQKAAYYFEKAQMPVFADDSGLEVDALGCEPGIHSARYGGFDTHAERRIFLLEKLMHVEPADRTARFRCAAVFFDGKDWCSAQGAVEGFIGLEEKGSAGFGYDPLFSREWDGPTYAQVSQTEKNSTSHRANAFHTLFKKMNLK